MLDNTGKKIKHQTKKQIRKVKRLIRSEPKQIGLPPGTLVYTGDKEKEPVKIKLINYSQDEFVEKEIHQIEEVFPCKDSEEISWINIDGIHNLEIMEKMQNHFNIHPLAMEDILHITQRPKMEEYGDYVFIVLRMLFYNESLKSS